MTISPHQRTRLYRPPPRAFPITSAASPRKNWRVGHRVPHELRQQLIRVDDSELSTVLRGGGVDAFGLEAWAKSVPVGSRWDEDDALAVGDRRRGEAADRAIQELLILIELDDVIAGAGAGQQATPRIPKIKPERFNLLIIF
ncbi:MAG: hypothetical protein ABIT71_16645 [Vicinamibacteraceae bacterium]